MPNKPVPQEVTVDSKQRPARFGFELSLRKSRGPCYKLINPVAKFPRPRAAGEYVHRLHRRRSLQGHSRARMPHAFKQRDDEPVIFPAAFDKFL